jgi:hypothetical protein
MESIIKLNDIARTVHQANKAYCESLGDFSQKDWEDAADWQRDSAIDGVRKYLDGSALTAEDQHQSWVDFKVAGGWVYGPTKSEGFKTHPCIVPYDQLPPEQKRKDYLFRAVVKSLTLVIE